MIKMLICFKSSQNESLLLFILHKWTNETLNYSKMFEFPTDSQLI